jgi:hypothetical protein
VIRVTDALSEERVTDPNFLGKDASSCFSCGPSSFYIVKRNPFLKQKHVSYAFSGTYLRFGGPYVVFAKRLVKIRAFIGTYPCRILTSRILTSLDYNVLVFT